LNNQPKRKCREVDCLPSTTFKPLRRGRFSCNKTGQVLPSPSRSKGHRSWMNGKEHPRARIIPVVLDVKPVQTRVSQYPTVQIDRDGDLKCPYCGSWNFGASPGQQMCTWGGCRKIYIALSYGSPADNSVVRSGSVPKIASIDLDDNVRCPDCEWKHYDVMPCYMRCENCRAEFRVVY
jgi:hypothetical protein